MALAAAARRNVRRDGTVSMYYTLALAVIRALIGGFGDVLRAPALILAAVAAMLVIAVPFGAVLGVRLQQSLAQQQPVSQGATEIDAEWWQEFRERAAGLDATFTPAILGFAAPLDNLSSLLDGTWRPLVLFVPYALSLIVWAFLWGAALDRFARGSTASGFWRAGTRTFARFVIISAMAAAAMLVLYFTLHPLLFGVVAERLQASASTEQRAFIGRLFVYVIFGAVLVMISLVAGYARVVLVASPGRSVGDAVNASWQFIRRHFGAVAMLFLSTGLVFVALLIAYGTLEVAGGSQVGGWRGVVIAQAYIIARLIIRLTFGASELRLYETLTAHVSVDRVKPGPPAAT